LRHAATCRPKRRGRPPTIRSIRALVLRLARENTSSGATAESPASSRRSISQSPPPPSGRSSRSTASLPRPNDRAPPGLTSCAARPRRCSPAISSRSAPRLGRVCTSSRSSSIPPHCRHWAEHTYGVFLPKHRVGNPGGYTEYFQQHPDGTYRLIK
jgi:hypothetical protein